MFELVERSGMVDEDDDLYDEDDEIMIMAIADGLDCIGCKACAAVCPKQCHTHQALAG